MSSTGSSGGGGLSRLDFDPYETLVDLVMDLTLITSGLLYCPIISAVVTAKLIIMYGLRVFHIWVNCSSSRQVHSGSYIRSLFYGLSSVVVMFSLVCHVFAVAYLDASSNCGPFKGMERIRDVFFGSELMSHHFQNDHDGANSQKSSFSYSSLTYVLVSTIFVLLFGLYISHLKRLSIERNANELKCQLAITTQEKCYLISKIKKPLHHDNAKAKTNT